MTEPPNNPPRRSVDSRSSAVPPERYPTAWAYEQVCAALEEHKRINTALQSQVADLGAKLALTNEELKKVRLDYSYQFAKREEAEREIERLKKLHKAEFFNHTEAMQEISGLIALLKWIRTGLPPMSEPARRIDVILKEQ